MTSYWKAVIARNRRSSWSPNLLFFSNLIIDVTQLKIGVDTSSIAQNDHTNLPFPMV
jgi:hypothetical protein